MNKLMIAAATFAACAAAEAADFQIGVYCLKENARTEQPMPAAARGVDSGSFRRSTRRT